MEERSTATLSLSSLNLVPFHAGQQQVYNESKRFNVLCMGRQWGKSTMGNRLACEPSVLRGLPVGWFTPTYKTMRESWREIIHALKPISPKINKQENRIELSNGGIIEFWSLTDPDAARGRRYGRIIIDEAAMIKKLEEAWIKVLIPTLIAKQGDAWFLSTPRGENFFKQLWDWGQKESKVDWASWRMPTWTNPFIGETEIQMMIDSMEGDPRAYEEEVCAEFLPDIAGALFSRPILDEHRVEEAPELGKIVVAIDPATQSGTTGICVGGSAMGDDKKLHGYTLESIGATSEPSDWAERAIDAYYRWDADYILYERNQGGRMVRDVIESRDSSIPIRDVHASRGKVSRGEPVSVLTNQGRVHMVGHHKVLEGQMCTYVVGMPSPDFMDSFVWVMTDLLIGRRSAVSISVGTY